MMRGLTALVNRLSQSQIHNSVHNHLNIKNVMKFSGLSLFPFTFFLGQSFHLHFYWSTVSISIFFWSMFPFTFGLCNYAIESWEPGFGPSQPGTSLMP